MIHERSESPVRTKSPASTSVSCSTIQSVKKVLTLAAIKYRNGTVSRSLPAILNTMDIARTTTEAIQAIIDFISIRPFLTPLYRKMRKKKNVQKEIVMEVKINREIRDYSESMFFGLSLRQLVFSVLAVGVAVGLYFILRPYFGMETVSWMCVLGAAPFAALGFVSYHGMTAEKFLWAWLRSEVLEPKVLLFKPNDLYYECLKALSEKAEKEAYKRHG